MPLDHCVRERLRRDDQTFSVRRVAQRIGIELAYLSNMEGDRMALPSKAAIHRQAADLREDPDLLRR